jgi:hypothetical protein
MLGTVAWIVAVVVGVIGLTVAFVLNARALWRDLRRRQETFRARLEDEANAMVDDLLRASDGERTSGRAPTDK